ncbi:zinc finger protein 846-like [Culicoides brevitarsis]|uniref:zinc finger protein 846-like n=1 Tax=Culicoides brevitarsis TaxID=469753 RepID=UPI00307BE1F1
MDSTEEAPPFEIEEVQVKNEPMDFEPEDDEEFEEAYNATLENHDEDGEQDKIDPFNFLKMHFSTSTEEQPSLTYTGKPRKHTCHICFQEYVDLKSIRRHLLRIHNINPPQGTVLYECPECPQKFSDKSHLNRHALTHSGIKPHVCPKCNKGFGRKEHLTRHLTNVRCDEVKEPNAKKDETTVEKPFSCPKCNKGFGRKDALTRHLSKIQCQEPEPKEQIDATELLTIIKVENVATEFPKCKICDKKFVHQTHLRVHMKTHDVQPLKFECPICGKNLSRKSHLSHHIRRIHSVKMEEESDKVPLAEEVSCHLCPKKFSEQLAYDRHIAMHSNDQIKKEICDICNHVFLSKWHVRKHKLHKHNIEPENGCLACIYCRKKFIDNYYLKRHYATKHKNETMHEEGNSFDVITKNENTIVVKKEPQMVEEYLEDEEVL